MVLGRALADSVIVPRRMPGQDMQRRPTGTQPNPAIGIDGGAVQPQAVEHPPRQGCGIVTGEQPGRQALSEECNCD